MCASQKKCIIGERREENHVLLSLRSSKDYRKHGRRRKRKSDDINLTCTRAHCYDNVFKCQRECTRPSLRNYAPSPGRLPTRPSHVASDTWVISAVGGRRVGDPDAKIERNEACLSYHYARND